MGNNYLSKGLSSLYNAAKSTPGKIAGVGGLLLALASCGQVNLNRVETARPTLNQDQTEQILFTRPVANSAVIKKGTLDEKVDSTDVPMLVVQYQDHSTNLRRYEAATVELVGKDSKGNR